MGFESIMRTGGYIEGKSAGRCASFTFKSLTVFVRNGYSKILKQQCSICLKFYMFINNFIFPPQMNVFFYNQHFIHFG